MTDRTGSEQAAAYHMERLIREYFDGCNGADAEKMTACFVDDAVHYFPPGMYGGPFVGAHTIAERWVTAVQTLGSVWTIDSMMTDSPRYMATIEWTHFKTYTRTVLRGSELYEFDPASGLIREIRAYYASPQDPDLQRLEIDGFDYEGRGFALSPPIDRGPRQER